MNNIKSKYINFGALDLTDKVVESDKHDTLYLLNLARGPLKLNGKVIAHAIDLVYTLTQT